MSDCSMIYKAGKITFLLVCLFFCVGCGKEKVVFEAGKDSTEMILEVGEEKKEPTEEKKKLESSGSDENVPLVNINTADAKTLMTLPGIGETRAAAIIEYRQQEGTFESIEDLMKVKGIKTGIFSKINNLICVK